MLVAVQCTDAEFANFHYYFILVSKFDLGLLNAYKLIYFDRNINGNKDGKKLRAINESCITRAEFPFSEETRKRIVLYSKTTVKIQISEVVEFSDF